MTSIVSYQKISTPYTIITMSLPDECTELATIDGVTYVAIPPDVVLPEQPPEIVVNSVVRTAELIAAIKAASPHCEVIAAQMVRKIRERYTVDDELFFARIAGGVALGMYELQPGEAAELEDYKTFVETNREWGRERRAALGLIADRP